MVTVYTAAGNSRLVEAMEIERIATRPATLACPDLIADHIYPPVRDDVNRRSVIKATIKNIESAAATATIA